MPDWPQMTYLPHLINTVSTIRAFSKCSRHTISGAIGPNVVVLVWGLQYLAMLLAFRLGAYSKRSRYLIDLWR